LISFQISMPPRHVYWTIIYGNQATAFRAATPEELLPTLKQLQSRHPDAALKFFARGRLWDSAEDARRAREERPRPGDRRPRTDHRPGMDRRQSGAQEGERRGKDWRPGGKHRDPRDRFKVPRDEKRRRFAQRLRRDRMAPRAPRNRPDKKKTDE
jgi:hypothetical protein